MTVSGAIEGAAFGAALVAAVGVGGWSSVAEAVSGMEVPTRDEPEDMNRQRYRDLFDIYQSLYGRLSRVFEQLSQHRG